VSILSNGRQTREQLARLEQRTEEQVRALANQQAAVALLHDRFAHLEKALATLGTQLQARFDDMREAIDNRRTDENASLDKFRESLKDVRGRSKGIEQDFKKLIGHLAQIGNAFDISLDDRFLDVAQPLMSSRRTMLGHDRLFTLWQAARNAARLNLAAAEIGAFRGGSAALLAQAMQTFGGSSELHVVDTFEGHIDSTFSEHDPEEQRGKFRGTSYEDVREFLSAFPGVQVHKGDAASVVSGWPERRYALVHLDVDLYRPTLDCLEYFAPRLAEGGIIVMDDYSALTCPGVSRATDEYLARSPLFQVWKLAAEQAVLIKHS